MRDSLNGVDLGRLVLDVLQAVVTQHAQFALPAAPGLDSCVVHYVSRAGDPEVKVDVLGRAVTGDVESTWIEHFPSLTASVSVTLWLSDYDRAKPERPRLRLELAGSKAEVLAAAYQLDEEVIAIKAALAAAARGE